MAKITISVPDQAPAKYDLGDEIEISLGRAPDCDIVIDHSSVSGHHAVIRQIGAGLHMLVDNNSTNGVLLEGNQISEAPLSNGASFTIGSVPGEYEADEMPAEEENSAAAPAEGEDSPAPASSGSSDSGGGYGAPVASIPETSARPAGFRDLSPVEKVVKKDSLKQIAMLIGLVGILGAIGLVLMTVMMNVD